MTKQGCVCGGRRGRQRKMGTYDVLGHFTKMGLVQIPTSPNDPPAQTSYLPPEDLVTGSPMLL